MKKINNLPKGWKIKKFGECFNFLRTANYSRAETKESETVHYIHYGDIHRKYGYHVQPHDINTFVSVEQAEKFDKLKNGDLILLDASEDYEGSIKCTELKNVTKENIISGLHTIALRDKDNNFINSFKAYLTSIPYVKNSFLKQITGIKVYGISKSNLIKIDLIIPPIIEQKRIAEVIECWDEGIEEISKVIALKEQKKKWLMHNLLSGKVRLKGFNKPWKEAKLGELRKIGVIKIDKGTTITANSKTHGNIPVIAGGQTYPYFCHNYTHSFPCITVSASGAYAGYVWYHSYKIWASDCNVVYAQKSYSTLFLAYTLMNNQNRIYKLQRGGAQPHVYSSDLEIINIPHIDLPEQSAIVEILSTADDEINQLKQKLELFKQQKKWLMQQLLTGTKRLNIKEGK